MDIVLMNSLLDRAEAAWKEGQADRVRALYERALEVDPSCGVALQRLAWLAEDAGNLIEAESLFRRFVAVRPDDARALLNLGLCLKNLGSLDEAVELLRRATEADPTYGPAFCNLGLLHEDQGKRADAVHALRTALTLLPDSGFIAYHLASLGGAAPPDVCPPDYLVQLFDGYADRFDAHLFQTLNYKGPQRLADIVAGHGPPKPWDVLDLGCGTGMTGVPFRAAARRMVGVDLSPRMLEHARRRVDAAGRPIYDMLIQTDIVEALRQSPESFDLILAADVFIYIGDVRPTLAAAYDALRPGGLIAFTTEVHNSESDFELSSTRRFSQSNEFILRLARALNFNLIAQHAAFLRNGDDGTPVSAHIYLLEKPPVKPTSAS